MTIFYLTFFFIQAYLLIHVYFPYLQFDRLQSWDASGHYFAAWFVKYFTFPNFTGWNPFFYGGYPQDTFYPPLYHYLCALLSCFIELSLSIKLITVFSVFILPISFYCFARKMRFSRSEASLSMLLMMLPIATATMQTGGTLNSTFFVGLGANALALPIFFFYLGKLRDPFQLKNLFQLSALLSLLILTHIITAFMAVFITLITLGLNFNKTALKYYFSVLCLTFLLSGFWIVPFLAYTNYYGGAFVVNTLGMFFSLPVFIAILLGLLISRLEMDVRFDASFLSIIILSIALVFVDSSAYFLPFHPYRFALYPFLLLMLFPIKMVFNRSKTLVRIMLTLIFTLCLLLHFYNAATIKIVPPSGGNKLYRQGTNNINYANLDIGKLDGRIIIYNREPGVHIHDLRHLTVMASKCQELKGLFVESSVNGKFVISLHVNAVRGGFLWGVESVPMERDQYLTTDPIVLQKNLDLFNVNHLLVNYPIQGLLLEKRIKIELDKDDYYLYRIGNSKIVELLNYQPLPIPYNWKTAVRKWFRNQEKRVLVNTSVLPIEVAEKTDSVSLIEMSQKQDYLKLEVKAKKDVPILIKMSYFPRWHAFVNGQERKIYTASPYLMLVYGKGTVELKYQTSLIDYFGYFLSIAGVFAAFIIYRNKYFSSI